MKTTNRFCAALSIVCALFLLNASANAQVIDPNKTAKAAVANDAKLITGNIENSEYMMYLSQQAITRGTDSRVKELADLMLNDHTSILYSMQQLASAGTGASSQNKNPANSSDPLAIAFNERLTGVSKSDFDTVWVGGTLNFEQATYDKLTQAKPAITNSQLQMAVTEALPLLRKHIAQLKSLQKSLIKMAIQKKKEAAAAAKAGKK